MANLPGEFYNNQFKKALFGHVSLLDELCTNAEI